MLLWYSSFEKAEDRDNWAVLGGHNRRHKISITLPASGLARLPEPCTFEDHRISRVPGTQIPSHITRYPPRNRCSTLSQSCVSMRTLRDRTTVKQFPSIRHEPQFEMLFANVVYGLKNPVPAWKCMSVFKRPARCKMGQSILQPHKLACHRNFVIYVATNFISLKESTE